ncbi:DUF3108 domain-containing protein [Gluconobacter morbifer]|uniref:DUF3108 domain-containing protein n=1 Tax=Gluconobacter morbifer G707 TaxID=1088869 RepID=G6XI49_9PROT|nr:DUF3108 domain-containing protein [Gluconobacter morbifer]EHH68489.1 hypothetical protein GMO_12590 [Gluconobacter morbifer G707]
MLLAGTASARADAPVNETFAVYLKGFHVLNASASYQLQSWGYGGSTHIQPAGIISWFITMDINSSVQGRFGPNNSVQPISYESGGLSRGKHRHVKLDFTQSLPKVVDLQPPETDREPIPDNLLPHTIDTLSGMAHLLQNLRNTGHCDGSETIFDGLRLTHLTVHGPTQVDLPQSYDEFYSGPSLRCDFIGAQTAGFVKDSKNRAKLASPQPGSAWFKQIEGVGLVPVRIEFNHPKMGHIVVVLQKAVQH